MGSTAQRVALVTGAAGFIGSRLSEELVTRGFAVRGVDSFTPYYERRRKRANLEVLAASEAFRLHELDLRTADLTVLLRDVDVVFHQAGQPGVRASWDEGFAEYLSQNVLGTQRLLEAVRHTVPTARVVFASSSSVYGEAERYPVMEDDTLHPYSPYGVTKLAAEQLCGVYARNFGLRTVSLRYFTVYGARQRPDMALYRLIAAALGEREFPMYGDGSQIRDFTHVSDVVQANVLAADADVPPGTVCNVSAGSSASLAELIDIVGEQVGRVVPVVRHAAQHGDVQRTGGSTERATSLLGWRPQTGLVDGVREQVCWMRESLDKVGRAAGGD